MRTHNYPGLNAFGEYANELYASLEQDLQATPARWSVGDLRFAAANPMLSLGLVEEALQQLAEALSALPDTPAKAHARSSLGEALQSCATGWIDAAWVWRLAHHKASVLADGGA